ncbi:M60 family metallopeptidase [Niabella sp.]|uniref:M60 family metallopeptidase n=1 Tax=Niabella sp. TaxID=1962976 RepID=UPI0026020D6F|nr:M60 family metallopeptidase [Niabella sp.]
MKKRFHLMLIAGFFLLGFSACNKYGYNFADAYEHGENAPNMEGGQVDSLGKDLSKLLAAKNFPGLVGAGEPRLTNVEVTTDFSGRYVPGSDIRIVTTPQPLYSTGLYAPTGEPITIEVPAGVTGVVAQIGGWTDNLNGVAAIKRDPLIYNQLSLQAGKNVIRNLYGGSIYLRTNGTVKELGTITVKISGAVRSPDFILGQSTDEAWNAQVRASTVPWFQLRGKRIIFELPKLFLDKHPIANPTELMQEWDRIIDEDIYKFKGLEDVTNDSLNKAPNHPIWVIMDAQPRLTYAHNSFPVVMQMDENLFTNEIADHRSLTTKGAWRTLFEIGRNHNTGFWLFNGLSGTAANLYSAKMAHRLNINYGNLNPLMKLAVDTGIWYSNQAKTFTSQFNKDLTARTNADLIKLLPFVQLFEVYGYELMKYIEYDARQYTLGSLNDLQKMDYFFNKACEYTKTDLSAFFRAWAIPVSAVVTDSIEKKYPFMTRTVFLYNPITKTGIKDSLMPRPLEFDRASWSVANFCCQEATTGKFYANYLFDGDTTTYWKSSVNHTPHVITFDMGGIADVGGFFYANASSAFRPKTIKVYVSWDNINWTQAYSGAGIDNGGTAINKLDFDGNKRYVGVRYIRFEMATAFPNAATVYTAQTAEFGARRGVATQTPVYPPTAGGEGQ